MQAQIHKYKFINQIEFKSLVNWSATSNLNNSQYYNDSYILEPIGNLILRNRNKILIQDDISYQQVTIKLYNKGVIPRSTNLIKGNLIGTKNQYIISAGQFIMSKIDARHGAFGIVSQNLEGAVTTQDFLSYNINEKRVDPDFFILLTTSKTFYNLCQKASSGTTGRQRIDEKAFLNFKVPVPSLVEQQKIVDNYKKKHLNIQSLNQSIVANQQNLKKYLENELGITDYVKTNTFGKFRLVNFSNLVEWGINSPSFKLRNFYANLKYKTLPVYSICNVGSGGTPSRANKSNYNGLIPWIKTGEVREQVIFETEEKITEIGLQNSSARIYPTGSLIVAMYGATAGRSAKLGLDAATNQACAVLYNIDNSIIHTDYLWIYLISQIDNLKLLASGSAQPNLNASKVRNYEVPIPSLDKQQEIISSVNAIKLQIAKETKTIATLLESAQTEFESKIFKNEI